MQPMVSNKVQSRESETIRILYFQVLKVCAANESCTMFSNKLMDSEIAFQMETNHTSRK